MYRSLSNLGISDHDADIIVSMMSEKHRFYHTVSHVLSLIANSDDPMIWAISWFHDIVYDPQSSDNELKSAEFCRKMMSSNNPLGLNLDVIYDAIIDTATHVPRSDISKEFCDLDMSILASSPEKYRIYRSQIRCEFGFVPWDVYRKKRAEILTNFNNMVIFNTQNFKDLEPIAHRNISDEINDLANFDELDFVGMFL